jgi:hypothetical protein
VVQQGFERVASLSIKDLTSATARGDLDREHLWRARRRCSVAVRAWRSVRRFMIVRVVVALQRCSCSASDASGRESPL